MQGCALRKTIQGEKNFQAVESRVTKIVFVAQQECKQCKMWPPMQTFLGVSHTSRGKNDVDRTLA